MNIQSILDTVERAIRGVLWNVSGSHTQIQVTDVISLYGKELSWRVVHNNKRDEVLLEIFDGANVWARLVLTKRGEFTGKSRQKGVGTFEMSCPAYSDMLGQFQNPRKYLLKKRMSEEPVEEPVLYEEDITPDIHIPEYQVISEHPGSAEKAEFPAIVIIACNRPNYFEKVVQALAQNEVNGKPLRTWPVYLFIDKPEDSSDDYKVDDQILEFKRQFPRGYVVKREMNFGCGKNIIDARRQVFDKVGHPRAYIFEDDMVPSRTYIQMCENMWKWAKECGWSNIGAIQGWEWCTLSNLGRERFLPYARATFTNWWGYSMSKKCWDSISPLIYQYEKDYLFSWYRERPHKTILTQFRKWQETEREEQGESQYPVQADYGQWRNRYLSGPPSGQDGCTMVTFELKGWVRLSPMVNRSQYIGKSGIHMTDQLWKRGGYDNILFREYDEDANRIEFEPQIDFAVDPGIDEADRVPGLNLTNIL